MRWLFIHKDFPGQYVHAVRHLADTGDEVVGIGQSSACQDSAVRVIQYAPQPRTSPAHPYVLEIDEAVQNGLAVAAECERLKAGGFVPDVVIGHNGWGETLFVKEVWPSVPLLGYFEFFYRPKGSDADFDPEFPPLADLSARLRVRNAINLMGLEAADLGQTPTDWQRAQYPRHYRDRLHVIHEGIDTDLVRPDRAARLCLGSRWFEASDQIITYSARDLEPYRGFHIFMRTLPIVLRELQEAHVLIVGGDGVSYGAMPANASGWRQALLDELGGEIDLRRVHFLGRLSFQHYLAVLQISTVHVYMTYPFILSWSLLEALSAGCLVVASRTPPVEEVLIDGKNGYLSDFFDIKGSARRIVELARTGRHDAIREAARETILDRYALKRCLPAYLSVLRDLAGKRIPPSTIPDRGGKIIDG